MEDDEFCWVQWGDVDQVDQLFVVEVVLCYCGVVVVYEEGFFGFVVQQCVVGLFVDEKIVDGGVYVGLQCFVVGFEDGLLCVFVDVLFQVGEVVFQIDVFLFGVGVDGVCVLELVVVVFEEVEVVDVFGVEYFLLGGVDQCFEVDGIVYYFVGWCFVDGVFGVVVGVDVGDEV